MGPRSLTASVILTLGQLQATLQMNQTLALPNAVPPKAAIRIFKAVFAQNAQITPALMVLLDLYVPDACVTRVIKATQGLV